KWRGPSTGSGGRRHPAPRRRADPFVIDIACAYHRRMNIHRIGTFAAIVLALAGCSHVLGLESWTDPPGGAGGREAPVDLDVPDGEAPPPAHCADGMKSGDESDVDCGGADCAPCEVGGRCGG